MNLPTIAIIGEYAPDYEPHRATGAAIDHSSNMLAMTVNAHWVSSEEITHRLFETHSAIWVAPGSPYKSMEKILWAIQYARENNIPCFGTCGGFQHMIIEYARHALGFVDAQHAEYDPYASNLFVSKLGCSLAGRKLQLQFAPGSRASKIYASPAAIEQYYCNFGVNPNYIEALKSGPLDIVGSDSEGEVRVIELPKHAFFLGTLFVPQMRSTPSHPHPLVSAFLQAAVHHGLDSPC